eukprot:1705251-Amphidinium_carterae.1
MQEATTWARELKYSERAVAVVSLEYLHGFERCSPTLCHIRYSTQQVRPVQAYVTQMGRFEVKCSCSVQDVQVSQPKAATAVLHIMTRESLITAQEWQNIGSIKDSRSAIAWLSEHGHIVIDLWKVSYNRTELSFLVRVKQCDVASWMASRDLPFVCTPVGDMSNGYRVLWDAALSTIRECHRTYGHLTGYAGIVIGQRSAGARVLATHYDSACAASGRSIGETYLVHGLPSAFDDCEIVQFLRDAQWTTEVVQHSRRVRRGILAVRVRATQPPPSRILRLLQEHEVYNVSVTRQERIAKPQPAPEAQPPPQTWAQAAQRAVGARNPSPPEPPPDVSAQGWAQNGDYWQPWQKTRKRWEDYEDQEMDDYGDTEAVAKRPRGQHSQWQDRDGAPPPEDEEHCHWNGWLDDPSLQMPQHTTAPPAQRRPWPVDRTPHEANHDDAWHDRDRSRSPRGEGHHEAYSDPAVNELAGEVAALKTSMASILQALQQLQPQAPAVQPVVPAAADPRGSD